MDNNIGLILKFGEKKYMNKLLYDGQLHMNTLPYYRKLEGIRRDKFYNYLLYCM